jgi:hypothetical protein
MAPSVMESPVNVADFAANLEIGEQGIWFSRAKSNVSYPSDGNASCFEIEDHSFWFQHRNRCIAAIIRGFPPSGALFDLKEGRRGDSRTAREIEDLVENGWPRFRLEAAAAKAEKDYSRRRKLPGGREVR